MEWLPGTVVGGAIGLLTALAITEYRACRDRKRRRTDTERLFRHEISLGKKVLEQILNNVVSVAREGGATEYMGPPFARDVYATCVADLSLLSGEACDAVLRFYHSLTDVDFIVQEGYLRRSLYRPSEPGQLDEQQEALQEMARWLWPDKGEDFLRKITLQKLLGKA